VAERAARAGDAEHRETHRERGELLRHLQDEQRGEERDRCQRADQQPGGLRRVEAVVVTEHSCDEPESHDDQYREVREVHPRQGPGFTHDRPFARLDDESADAIVEVVQRRGDDRCDDDRRDYPDECQPPPVEYRLPAGVREDETEPERRDDGRTHGPGGVDEAESEPRRREQSEQVDADPGRRHAHQGNEPAGARLPAVSPAQACQVRRQRPRDYEDTHQTQPVNTHPPEIRTPVT